MEKEMEEQKAKMRNFKITKLVILLNSMVVRQHRTNKYQTFNHLQSHMLQLNLKFKKLNNHIVFNKKHKMLRLWAAHVKNKLVEREIAMEDKLRQKQKKLENKADRKKLMSLLRLGLKSLQKYKQHQISQREIEAEHENRKLQIDNFFANLRERV